VAFSLGMSEKLLFLVSRTDVYDYDSFIVCCLDEARKTHPRKPGLTYIDELKCWIDEI
jgi:hypothetical protein